MVIFRVQKKDNYVVLDKGFLNDNRLSWRAKGLLAYMLSLPNDWLFSISDLAIRSKCGRDTTANIIKELTNAGYIHKEQGRTNLGKFGKMDLLVFETPQSAPFTENQVTENPLTENPLTENPLTENPSLLINKSLNNNLLNNNLLKKNNNEDRSHLSAENHSKIQTAFQFYEQNGFGALAAHVAYKIGHWIDDLSEELVIHAMKLAVENNILRWNYVEKILHDWTNKKFRTIEEVEAHRLRYTAQKKQRHHSIRSNQQGRQEIVPEWFHQRHEDNNETEAGKAIDFEAERQKILATLREAKRSKR
ncbi:DnaD domain protein [Lysinibacillus sphaericus]|uniref:DnaD domain protein n=1 Tax=Lysinibacillus sphaericus TaxID=1421 RepID=UPI001CBDE834|nr:DnaD domain protein [Lysinibacillus sphaericus]